MAREEQFRRVVADLLADPGATRHLLGLERTAAFIAMEDSSVAVIIHPTKRGEALRGAMQHYLDTHPRVHHKLVIIGGDADMQPLLTACQPGTFSRRMVQVYQLLDSGTVWSGRASRLDSPVGRALEASAKTASGETPSLEALAQKVRRPTADERKAHSAQQDFARGYRAGRPLWTYGAVALLLGVFGLQLTWGGGGFIPSLIRMGANSENSLGAEPWRLLSSIVLHGSWLHVGANAFMLYVLGGHLERILGWARLVLLLVVAGAVGAVLSAVFREALISVGASGAIFGTLGAAAMVALRPQGLVPPNVAVQLRRAAFLNLALNAGVSFLPGVDYLAHLGGGLAGVALVGSGLLTRGLPPVGDRSESLQTSLGLRVAACLAAAAVVGSFALACVRGRPWALAGPIRTHPVEVGATGLVVKLPHGTTAFVTGRGGEGAAVFDAGDAMTDPYVLSVTVLPIVPPGPVTAADREAFLARETVPDSGATLGPRRIIEGADWPTFEEVHTYPNGAQLLARHSRLLREEVVVAVFLFADAPAAVWTAAKVSVASLEDATPETRDAGLE